MWCYCCYYCTGEAALYILRAEFGDDWSKKVKVIFIGDDTTDEDAMKVNFTLFSYFVPCNFYPNRIINLMIFFQWQALKGDGLSFRVSSRPEIETYADYRVPSTKTVSLILQWLQDTMNQV